MGNLEISCQQKSKTILDDLIERIQRSNGSDIERDIKGGIITSKNQQNASKLTWKQLHQLLIQPIADLLPTKPGL